MASPLQQDYCCSKWTLMVWLWQSRSWWACDWDALKWERGDLTKKASWWVNAQLHCTHILVSPNTSSAHLRLTAPERKIIIHSTRTDELRHMVGPVTKPVDETILYVWRTDRSESFTRSIRVFVQSTHTCTHSSRCYWTEIWWKSKRRWETICFYETHTRYTRFMTPKQMKINIFPVSIQFGSFA